MTKNIDFKTIYHDKKQHFIELWKNYLRFKSISTDSAFKDECLLCANWVKNLLEEFGFKTDLIETTSLPLVTAEFFVDTNKPTILIYGHYDVQPVDPLNLWESDPFEPEIRNNRMYARGAVDNKGQTLPTLLALGELKKLSKLNCNIKVIMEGEEENGSEGLFSVMDLIGKDFKADVLMVSDTGTLSPEYPAMTFGLRGLAMIEAILKGPNKDLHSGTHGGVVKNPAVELAKIVAKLHDENGRIAIPNFYNDVLEYSQDIKDLVNAVPITEEEYANVVGVRTLGGENGYTLSERRGIRPTIEVNGLHSGYGGEGGKTIIPSVASVKLTARLVNGQTPEKVLSMIKDFFVTHAPKEMKLSFINETAAGSCINVDPNSKYSKIAREVLKENYGVEPLCLWEGGSIPVLQKLINVTGTSAVFSGFECLGDGSHSPNESFLLDQFERSFLYAAKFIERVSEG